MHLLNLVFYVLSLLITTHALADSTAADAINLKLMHTKPICNHEGKTPAWCTYDDLIPSSEASGMIENINQQIDLAVNPKTAKLYVAYFSFSNKPIFRKLCEKAQAGISIEFFLDSSYRTSTLAQDLINCGSNNNVKFHFIGHTDTTDQSNIIWRLHHNKFMIIDSGDETPVNINFSSGNLSAYGTSLHYDHWVTITAPRTSNIYNTHLCVIQAMLNAVDPDGDGQDNDMDDPALYRTTLNKCLKDMNALTIDDAILEETIAPLFSPNPQNEIANRLVEEINSLQSGETLRGAIQHFTHNSIARALTRACERGVNVQMIMDDDILTGESEVPGVQEFYSSMLQNTCVNIQFMQTNAEGFQMMHNKFLVLGNRRVFAGAGHFTYSAMTVNYENFYLMQSQSIVDQYNALFDGMWSISLTESDAQKFLDGATEGTVNAP